MTALGATGCSLYVSLDLIFGVPTDASGRASFALPVPKIRDFVGVRYFTQFATLEPGWRYA